MEFNPMKRQMNRQLFFLIGTLVLMSIALTFPSEGWTKEPTLARLSFWVPVAQMAAFEAAYHEVVVPSSKGTDWKNPQYRDDQRLRGSSTDCLPLDRPPKWRVRHKHSNKSPHGRMHWNRSGRLSQRPKRMVGFDTIWEPMFPQPQRVRLWPRAPGSSYRRSDIWSSIR